MATLSQQIEAKMQEQTDAFREEYRAIVHRSEKPKKGDVERLAALLELLELTLTDFEADCAAVKDARQQDAMDPDPADIESKITAEREAWRKSEEAKKAAEEARIAHIKESNAYHLVKERQMRIQEHRDWRPQRHPRIFGIWPKPKDKDGPRVVKPAVLAHSRGSRDLRESLEKSAQSFEQKAKDTNDPVEKLNLEREAKSRRAEMKRVQESGTGDIFVPAV